MFYGELCTYIVVEDTKLTYCMFDREFRLPDRSVPDVIPEGLVGQTIENDLGYSQITLTFPSSAVVFPAVRTQPTNTT